MASNKSPDYTKHPKNIFIMVNCTKDYDVFCNSLDKGLEDKFKEKGIASDDYIRDPLSLETDEDVNKKIIEHNPDALLMIQQTVTGKQNAVFELTLIDKESKKHVWKSQIEIGVGDYVSFTDPATVDKSVKTIFDKLVSDKIIE